ncbi:MAG: hypothetical protein PWR10_1732 [Halanaerobiales bacterium]|nr:hypothetical protein [Halanaerobiales bacterium]
MGSKLKNATFSLPTELLEKIREYAKMNYIPSINAGVKETLEEYVKKMEKEKLYKEMLEASKDPLFMKDLEENMELFEPSDDEVAGRQEEW